VRLLAALPLGVALTAVLGDGPEAAGKDDGHGSSHRRHRRKAKHRHQTGQDKENRKGKRKGKVKRKKPCTPSTCPASACGSQPDGCGGTIVCACTGNQICVGGTCHACDVCASGCPRTSVQAAVAAASPGATIHICPGAYQNVPVTEELRINKNLTLIGAGDGIGGTSLQGTVLKRVLRVETGITAALQGLRITGGADSAAGGFLNDGTTTMTNCTVIDNAAQEGGGIANSGGSLTLIGCTVRENDANLDGGGIYNENGGTVILDGTTVTRNRANLLGGASTGGGIFNVGGTVTLQNGSSVTDNTPDNCAPPGSVPGCSG
jgi:hypothetical protein